MKTSYLASIAFGAAAAAFSLAAIAQAQTPPLKVITKDEYRACLDDQDVLKVKADSIRERGAKLNTESDAIRAEDDELKAEQKRVEESSMPLARERFDRKVKAHTARIKAAEAEGAKLRAEADQVQKDLEAHNAKCSNVSIKTEDREAVQKERETAGKK